MNALLLLISLAACGGADKPAPAPASRASSSPLADALAGLAGPDEKPAKKIEALPPAPAEAREVAAPTSAPPPSSAECAAARSRRESLSARVADIQRAQLLPAEDALNAAEASMTACIGDNTCAMDGKRVQELQTRSGNAQAAYERASEQIANLEAGYFEIDQQIHAACGR